MAGMLSVFTGMLKNGLIDNTPIGRNTPATVQATGFAPNYVAKSADYTATRDDCTVAFDATGAVRNFTLNGTGILANQIFIVKKTDSSINAVNLVGTVDGVTNKSISLQNGVMIVQRIGVTANFVLLGTI